ncbi:TPA: flagellar export protein FliJ [Salmonella enterica]|uniref:Flagellar FliJ protein n=1 Tax=Salmonella enterica TaxID=28901 RepID=A0A756YI61_SALER|nr:flagellar export protein FliJ [Salmonella enterica subsp. enterica serovar Richmond]HAG0390726.1 flagellar export protein FliJ [Salmonella enterica]
MESSNSMEFLFNMAEQTLSNTTSRLGVVRQEYIHETHQLNQLHDYEKEYQQKLQHTLTNTGISVISLQCYQGFIGSLRQIVTQQEHKVLNSRGIVNDVLLEWKKNQQNLKAYEILKKRSDNQRFLKESRLEQKMMDEFARRAASKRKNRW